MADTQWKAAMMECRMCGNQHAAVYPYPPDEENNMECPNCGHMTCEPSEESCPTNL